MPIHARLGPTKVIGGLCVAVCLPALLAYSLPPSPTALNQAFAIGAWGLAVAGLWGPGARLRDTARRTATVHGAAAVVGLAGLASWLVGGLPSGLALAGAVTLALASVTLLAGSAARADLSLWLGLFVALLIAGLVSLAIGVVQVFAPDASTGPWMAHSGMPGRAVGNLRQPNHLSTLLLWSAAAIGPLWSWVDRHERAVSLRAALALAYAALLFGVVLSGSRTGLLGAGILTLWGLLDRGLSRPLRALLLASPLLCLASGLLLSGWSAIQTTGALGVSTRLGESDDISGARFAIWRDTLALIAAHPWLGVGFGEFNFAWTLTPFPQRNGQFFDHTHNLPLQLIVELGLPLGLLVLGLLCWGLWQAFRRSRDVPGIEGISRRACFVMVVLMAWHSQLEYPLWYAYFLLPTAFLWGLCLAPAAMKPPEQPASRRPNWLLPAGLAMILAAAVALWDYSRVVAIFAPPDDDRRTLVERIVEGRHSWFFAHHADYAMVTTLEGAGTLPGAFDRAAHFLLDTRLMIAWSKGLAAQGDAERARYIAARLREFRNPSAKDFFAPCDDPALADKPFQCAPPTVSFTWRDFLPK